MENINLKLTEKELELTLQLMSFGDFSELIKKEELRNAKQKEELLELIQFYSGIVTSITRP